MAVGVAIATKFPNPWIAIPMSFASHFLLDKVPHWNPHIYTETQKHGKPSDKSTLIATLDICLAFATGVYFSIQALPDQNLALLILACSLFSVLSDVVKYPYYYFKIRSKLMVWWVHLERSIQVDTKQVWTGVLTQLIIVAASFWWILN